MLDTGGAAGGITQRGSWLETVFDVCWRENSWSGVRDRGNEIADVGDRRCWMVPSVVVLSTCYPLLSTPQETQMVNGFWSEWSVGNTCKPMFICAVQ